MKKSLLLLAILSVVCTSAWGFDGTRKGFVLGGGLGFAPAAKWSAGPLDETKAGVGAQILIGYAWDEQNMIVYEGNIAVYNSDMLYSIKNNKNGIGQGFDGASYYHYFGPVGHSAFMTGGIGLYYFKVGDADANDPGGAIQIGGGYEFARHFQFGAYFSAGKTTLSGVDFNHSQFNILVSAIAF